VTGCAIAFYLAKQGIETVVLEADILAAMGSGRSMGVLRTQGRDLDELPLAIESQKIFSTLNNELDYDTEYRRNGHLRFVYSGDYVPTLKAWCQRQEDFGYHESKLITSEKVYKLVPALRREAAGGMFCAVDGDINPIRMNYGYSLGAKKYGAKILLHTPVKKINVSKGRIVSIDAENLTIKTNWVVNAAGVHAREISKSIGIDLPIVPLIYEVLVTEPLPPFLTPVLQCPDKKFGCCQTLNGNILFGSSVPNDLTYDMAVTREKFKERVKLMMSIFHESLREVSIIRSYAGLFDITPDLLPVIDSLEYPRGYFLAAGFSGHGLAICPAVGKRVAEWVSTGKPPTNFEKFGYSRFVGTNMSEFKIQKGKYSFLNWTKLSPSNSKG